MATASRQSRRHPQPVLPTPSAPIPDEVIAPELEPAEHTEPEAALGVDRVCLYIWLGGAAILLVLHGWHHFVSLMDWWN